MSVIKTLFIKHRTLESTLRKEITSDRWDVKNSSKQAKVKKKKQTQVYRTASLSTNIFD